MRPRLRILLKIGTYGFLRFSIPMLPDASALFMPWILWLSVGGIIYGALVALVQTDIKRLIAYSSVSHLGFCMLGLFAFNAQGVEGGTLQMINHGLSTGGLFALVGMLYERYHTREISSYGGLARRAPWLTFFMLINASAVLVLAERKIMGFMQQRYGPYLVMQTLDQGMDRARDLIADCLRELLAPAGILFRNDASVRKLEGLPQEVVTHSGEIPERAHIHMNGLKLEADLLRGQKTGVYLDQRENYIAAARWARGRVLDCFTSTGGFALHAAAKAESVDAVDSSAPALATAEANARANNIANVTFRQADVFEYLAGAVSSERRYSMIVLDPPAFAKSRRAVDDAARALSAHRRSQHHARG